MGEPSPRSVLSPAHDEDLRLMQLCVAEDGHARRMVANRLVGRVVRLVHALIGSGPSADDAAQQVLLEILRAAARFRGESSLEWWADRICVRVTRRLAQSDRRRLGRLEAVEPDSLPASAPARLEDALPRPLDDYLGGLTPAQRQALVLRHALDWSVTEIAELGGGSASTVKYRIQAALRKVRRAIARDRLSRTKEDLA